jgi:ankyrin repeat protein
VATVRDRPECSNAEWESTLIYACGQRHQGIPGVAEKIIQYGAGVNGRNKNRRTALYDACDYNRTEIVDVLLSNGADPNLPGPNLPIEASYRHPDCMRLLLRSGVDVHAKKEFMEKSVWHNCIEVVQQFLDASVDANSKTNDYWSPLTTAIRDNRPEIMTFSPEERIQI